MMESLETTYTEGRFAIGVLQDISVPDTAYGAVFSNIEVWTPPVSPAATR